MDDISSSPLSQRINFIGRKKIIQKIQAAITNPSRPNWLFYVNGSAGIGKTRLLEEIGQWVKGLPNHQYLWAGIIDLYHTEFHSPSGVRQTIIDTLDPQDQHFKLYRKIRDEYENKRDKGLSGKAIEDLRQQVEDTFRNDYKKLAEACRIVLTFDTAEFMQYESDSVQEICRLEEEGTVVKNWLLEQVSQLDNTVIILAGRPREKMEQQFVARYQKLNWLVETPTLDEFSFDETKAYLAQVGKQAPELLEILGHADNQKHLYSISQGRPIYLAIILDLIRSDTGLTFGDIFETLTPHQEKVGVKLVELYTGLQRPWYDIIYWLVRARKGVDISLLQYLTGWETTEAQQNMTKVCELAIVKYREKTGQLFLHDEIYDRIDQFYRNDAAFIPSIEPLADYYRQLNQLRELNSDELVARLYYELRVDPRRGYHEFYARWDEEAILRHNVGLDMRLRDEVLHFLNRYTEGDLRDPVVINRINRDDIDRDCSVRWVKRYVHRGQYMKADEVAASLRNSTTPLFNWGSITDSVYKASLLTVWSQARLNIGQPEKFVRPLLKEAIEILNEQREWIQDEKWWQTRILGEAYHLAGLMYRQAQKINEAIKYYSAAIRQYRQTDMKSSMVSTLSDRAYAYALIGDFADARDSISDAIGLLTSEITIPYLLARTLNVQASIYQRSGNPHEARAVYEKAMNILTELGEERLKALVYAGLGRTYRMLGNLWQAGNTEEDVEKFYQLSLESIKKTEEFYQSLPNSEMALWCILEKSKLERNWGLFKRATHEYKAADERFEESLSLLAQVPAERLEGWSLQKADFVEDEVDIYVIIARLEEAETKIKEAESVIPTDYHLIEGCGFKSITEPIIQFWSLLGRLELHRARIEMLRTFAILPHIPKSSPPSATLKDVSQSLSDEERLIGLKKAVSHYAKALAYFLHFSYRRSIHEPTFREIYNVLKDRSLAVLQEVRSVVQEEESRYKIDLSPLLTQIDTVLGVNPADQTELIL